MPDYMLPEHSTPLARGIDKTLDALRKVAEFASNVPITLSVSGGIMTGMLISGQKYFEQIADRMERAQHSKGTNATVVDIVEGWRALARELGSLPPAEEASQDSDYLHIEGAKIISGAKTFPADGMLWRVRISDVSGWSIGAYG